MTIKKFTKYQIQVSKNRLPHELILTFEEFSKLKDETKEALINEAENYKNLYGFEAREFNGSIEVQTITSPSISEISELDKSLVLHRRLNNIY